MRWIHWLLCALLLAGALWADDIDDFQLDEQAEKLTPAEVNTRLHAALGEADAAKRPARLLAGFDLMLRYPETLIPSRDRNRYLDTLLREVPAPELRPYVPDLLRAAGAGEFDVAARHRLDVGIRLAAGVGGATLAQLRPRLDHRDVDLSWLLPAIGRAGGKAALPLLQPYRQDAAIIPINHAQNIRRVPCGAVIGCAWAGDPTALELALQWYEEDTTSRPRFAGYIAWALQEGHPPDYEVFDYCQQRLSQVETLLDHLPADAMPDLIERALRDLDASLAGYLKRRLERTPDAGLSPFLPLLDHPWSPLRRRVAERLWARGNLQPTVRRRLLELLHSDTGLDRLFAARILAEMEPETPPQPSRPDPNPAVERRFVELFGR